MTCEQVLDIARKGRPNVTYTRNRQGTAIAAFKDGTWHTVAGLCIDGHWVSVGDLFIDGEPVNKQSDWIPV